MALTREAWQGIECDGLFLIFDTHAHIHNGDGSGALSEARTHVATCVDCRNENTYLDQSGDLVIREKEITGMITPMTVTDAEKQRGCWLEGSRGWRASAALVDIAAAYGMALDTDENALLTAFKDGQETITLSTGEQADVTECVTGDMAAAAETWLNEHIAPEDWAFGWHDGEFFLWPDSEWEEEN